MVLIMWSELVDMQPKLLRGWKLQKHSDGRIDFVLLAALSEWIMIHWPQSLRENGPFVFWESNTNVIASTRLSFKQQAVCLKPNIQWRAHVLS